jgi:hypothetical protein
MAEERRGWGLRRPTHGGGDQTTGVRRAQIAVVAAADGQNLLLDDLQGLVQLQQHMAAQAQAGLKFRVDDFPGPQLIELFDVLFMGGPHHHIQVGRQFQRPFQAKAHAQAIRQGDHQGAGAGQASFLQHRGAGGIAVEIWIHGAQVLG